VNRSLQIKLYCFVSPSFALMARFSALFTRDEDAAAKPMARHPHASALGDTKTSGAFGLFASREGGTDSGAARNGSDRGGRILAVGASPAVGVACFCAQGSAAAR
jgi:hypothetical protein